MKRALLFSLLTFAGGLVAQITPPPNTGGGSMVYPAAGIPQSVAGTSWGASLGLVTTVGSPGADTNLPSEKAVRSALSLIVPGNTAYQINGSAVGTAATVNDVTGAGVGLSGSLVGGLYTRTWSWTGVGATGLASALPGTCTAGSQYFATDSLHLSVCSATNVWTDLGRSTSFWLTANGAITAHSIVKWVAADQVGPVAADTQMILGVAETAATNPGDPVLVTVRGPTTVSIASAVTDQHYLQADTGDPTKVADSTQTSIGAVAFTIRTLGKALTTAASGTVLVDVNPQFGHQLLGAPTSAPTDGHVVVFDGTTGLTKDGGTAGTVTGPGSSTTGHVATFADGTGNVLQDGGAAGSGTVTNGSALTLNAPVLGAGLNAVAVGTRTGNTTAMVTADASSKTSGNTPAWDANGNLTNGNAAAVFTATKSAFFKPFGNFPDLSAAMTPSRWYVTAFMVNVTVAVDHIAFDVGVGSGTSCSGGTCGLVFAILNASKTILVKSSVFVSGGSPDINTTGALLGSIGAITLTPGIYYLSVGTDSSALQLKMMGVNTMSALDGNVSGGYCTQAMTGNGAALDFNGSSCTSAYTTALYPTVLLWKN